MSARQKYTLSSRVFCDSITGISAGLRSRRLRRKRWFLRRMRFLLWQPLITFKLRLELKGFCPEWRTIRFVDKIGESDNRRVTPEETPDS